MKTNRKTWMLTLGSFVLLLASVADAATVHGQLVYASNNTPAPYVAVRLNAPGRGASEFAYTGSDGKYYLRNVPAGAYQLEVWRGNKLVLTVDVTVQEPDAALATARIP
ncbi:MAG TPA: carboxypeptidase-like regulatory domain-containing protein [Acidobacteriota bacterium]|nr:carboxypeptidase-like regulatory domain-containing protein [Acidobacteriota bacterium]